MSCLIELIKHATYIDIFIFDGFKKIYTIIVLNYIQTFILIYLSLSLLNVKYYQSELLPVFEGNN